MNKTYGTTLQELAIHLIKTAPEGYAMVGWNFANGQDFLLIKTDASGNMKWNKTYGGTKAENGYALLQSGDGGYVLTGNTNSFGAGGNDILLVKTDAAGVVLGGKFGSALEFDGVDDYVQVQDSPSLRNPSTELTVEAWIYFPSNSSGLQLIIRKWIDSDGGWPSYIIGKTADNRIYGAVTNKGLPQEPTWTTTQTITALGIEDTWAHVAFAWKKETITAADGHIFVNGSAVATAFEPRGYSTAFTIGYGIYPLYIGRKAEAPSFSSNYFKGIVDEVRISNVSRTAFNLTSAPAADANTIALWHFDEGTVTYPLAYDASANANNGVVFGAVWTGFIPEFPSVVLLAFVIVLSSVATVGTSRLKNLKSIPRR